MEVQERIDSLVHDNPVVLFMKGERSFPRCGFSATVVNLLDRVVADYVTVDVLQDEGLREGVKVYANWPTIPQLYVGGEFVGGCDIVRELYETGELQTLLGAGAPSAAAPELEVTEAAATELRKRVPDDGLQHARLQIDARLQPGLGLGGRQPGDVEVEAAGITFLLDPDTARRADGALIDFADGPDGGFAVQTAPHVEA